MKPYYEHAGITIYHADCREVLPFVGEFDLCLTDPPYGVVNRESFGLRNLDKADADNGGGDEVELITRIAAKSFYVWCSTEQVSGLRSGFVSNGYSTRLAIWEKTNPSPMNGEYLWLSGLEACVYARAPKATFTEFCKSPIWRGPTVSVTNHPTEKPLWLFQRLVSASTNHADTVLDPFMGSGTTLVAAKQLGRKAVGIEINEKYCEIAALRLSQEVMDFGEVA